MRITFILTLIALLITCGNDKNGLLPGGNGNHSDDGGTNGDDGGDSGDGADDAADSGDGGDGSDGDIPPEAGACAINLNPAQVAPGASAILKFTTGAGVAVASLEGLAVSVGKNVEMTVSPWNTKLYSGRATNAEGTVANCSATLTVVDPDFKQQPACTKEQIDAAPMGGGTGAATDPYLICTITQLRAIKEVANGGPFNYQLRADLDFAGEPNDQIALAILSGTLDGDQHVVRNYTLHVQNGDATFIGDVTANAMIKNLTLENVDIRTENGYASGLARTFMGNIDNVRVTGKVHGTGYVGGLVVQLSAGSATNVVSNVISEVELSGTQRYLGGIIAHVYNNVLDVTIRNAHFKGTITGDPQYSDFVGGIAGFFGPKSGTIEHAVTSNSISGASGVGGLVGMLGNGQIKRSYATGTLTARESAGGLVGTAALFNSSSITDSFSQVKLETKDGRTGGLVGSTSGAALLTIKNTYFAGSVNVSAPSASGFAAGLVAQANDFAISNSFAAGKVTAPATSSQGGLVGFLNTGAEVNAYYWDVDRTGQKECATLDAKDPGCIGVNTDGDAPDHFFDPQAPVFSTWDFAPSGPWQTVQGNFPLLR